MASIDRLQTRAEADGYRHARGAALDRLKAFVEARKSAALLGSGRAV